MASIVDLEFRASANFSDLISQVNAANQQIQRLNMSMRKLNVEGFNSAMASFSRSLAQSGQFTTQSLIIDDGVKKFGKALGQGNLSLRESTTAMREFIRTRDGQVRQLARQQVQLERSVWTSTGRSASGQSRGMLATPTGLPNDTATSAALATKEMQIFHRVINETSKGLINWGKNTQWAGRQLMVGLSIPLSIFGTTAAKTFMDFDKELTRLSRVYGASITSSGTQALDSIKSQVKDLSRELSKALGIPAAETAGLAADLAATGLEGEKLIGAIKQTSILATLGEVDRQQAMKTTLSLQSVFRSDTKQLAKDIDFLNAVENQTSASIDDLTTAIPKAGPVVRGLGGDVKDLATMLVAMKEGGIPAGEAANAIKSSLSALINPTKEVSKYMKSFGIDLTEIVDKNAGKLMPTLNEFQGKLNALDDLSRQRVLEKLFGKMQVGRITALFNNLNQEGSQSVEVMKLAGMATADLAALTEQELSRAANSVSGQFKRAAENLKSNLVPIGEQFLKLGTKIFGALGTMLEKFNNLPSGFKQFILGLTTLVAVVGPVIMLVGVFATFFGYLVKAGVLLSAFKKGGLSAFKYVTAEEQAAKLAGDQLTKTFYDQVTATNTFKSAVANLALQFKELADNATAASVATGNASQSPAGREASSDVATASSSQKPQKTARDLFSSFKEGVSGKSMMDLFDPEIVKQSKDPGSATFKNKDLYNRTHLLDLSNDFWKTNPLSILGVMGSTSNKNQTLQEEWKVSSRDLYAGTDIAQTVGINAQGTEAERLKRLEDAQKDKNKLENDIAEREARIGEARAAGNKKSESRLKSANTKARASLAELEASLPELQRQAASYNRDEVIQTQAKALGKTRYLSEATPEEAATYVKERKGKTQAERVQLDTDLKIGGPEDIKLVEKVYAESQQQAQKTMSTKFAHIDQSTEAYAANLDSLITEYFVKNLAKLESELQDVAKTRGVNAEKIVYGDAKRSLTDETGTQSPEIQAADKNYQESMQRLAAAVDERTLVQEQLTESEQKLKNIYDEAAGRTEAAIDKYNKALQEQASSLKALDKADKKVEKAKKEYAAAQEKVTGSTNASIEDLDNVSKKQAEFDAATDERIAAAKRVTAADTAVTSTSGALTGAVAEEIIAADILTTEIKIETEQLRQSHPEDNDNVGDTTVVPVAAGGDRDNDRDKPKAGYRGGVGKASGAAFAVGGIGAITGQTSGPLANITQAAFAVGSLGMALEGLGVAAKVVTSVQRAMDTVTASSSKATMAMAGLGGAAKSAMMFFTTNPIGWLILAVAALAAGVWYLNKRMSAAAETTQSFGKIGQDASELFNDKITKLRANLNGMKEDIDAATKRYDEMKKAIDGLDKDNQIKKLIEDLKNEVSPGESVPRKMVQIYSQLVSQGMDAQKVRDLIQIVLDEAGQGGYKTVVNLAIDKINVDKNKQKALLKNTFEGLFAGALEPGRFDKWQKTSVADIQKNVDALAKSRDAIIDKAIKDGKTKKQAEQLYNQQYDLVKTGVKGASDALGEFGISDSVVTPGIDIAAFQDAQGSFNRLADDFKELTPEVLKATASTISGILGNINETDPAGLEAAINLLSDLPEFNVIFGSEEVRKQFIADLGVAGTLYEKLIGEEDNSKVALQLAALAAAGVNDKLAESAYNADKLDGTLGSVNSRLGAMQVVTSIDKALAADLQANAPKVKASTTAQGKKDAIAAGYDAQKKAIQGKIDVIKKEIEAINKKLEAEKKAFEFERKMRASQISYREALAAGKFGEAALIKNQMNNDMLDKKKEDEAAAKIDPKQAQIDKLQAQLDAIDKMKENSSTASSPSTKSDEVTQTKLDSAWDKVTAGIRAGTIKSGKDLSKELSSESLKAIKDAGYGIDEFFNNANSAIEKSITTSLGKLDASGKKIFEQFRTSNKDLTDALKLAEDYAYLVSRGADPSLALTYLKNKTVSVSRNNAGETTGFSWKNALDGFTQDPNSKASKLFNKGFESGEGGNYANTPAAQALNGALSNYADGNALRVKVIDGTTPTNSSMSPPGFAPLSNPSRGGGANYYGSGMGGSNSYYGMGGSNSYYGNGGGADDYDSGMGGSNSYSGSGASAYNGRSSYLFGPQKSSALYDATADQRASDKKASTPASSSSSSGSSGTQDSSYLEGSADSSAGSQQVLQGAWGAKDVKGPFDRVKMKSWANYPFYNNREGRAYGGRHAGLDYPASVGTNVFTTRGGKVVMSRYMASTPGYGNFVVVEDDKLKYVYAHLSTRNVKEGQSVVEGQQIGKSGRSGLRDSDPHLHFEVRDKDSSLGNRNWKSTYDPRNYLHTGGNVNKLSTADKSLKRDEVPAVLQSGEYVIQRKAVSRYGERFMDMINNGDLPGQAVPKFHTGGMVPHAHEDGPNSPSMSYSPRTGKRKITRRKKRIPEPKPYLSVQAAQAGNLKLSRLQTEQDYTISKFKKSLEGKSIKERRSNLASWRAKEAGPETFAAYNHARQVGNWNISGEELALLDNAGISRTATSITSAVKIRNEKNRRLATKSYIAPELSFLPKTYLSAPKPENTQSLDQNYTEDFHRKSGFMGLLHKPGKFLQTPYEQGVARALSTALLLLNTGKGMGGLNPKEAWNNSKFVAPGQALAGGIDALNNKWTHRDKNTTDSNITPEEELRNAIANRSKITHFSQEGILGKIANLSSGSFDASFRMLDPLTYIPINWAFKGAKAGLTAFPNAMSTFNALNKFKPPIVEGIPSSVNASKNARSATSNLDRRTNDAVAKERKAARTAAAQEARGQKAAATSDSGVKPPVATSMYDDLAGQAADRPLSRVAKSISSRVKNARSARDRGELDINPMNWLRGGANLSEKDAARNAEVAALLKASNAEAGSDAFSGMPVTELGELTGALGGHSSAIPGVNGRYRDAFGQLHVVKGHTDSASAYAEARGSQLTTDLFGLKTPDQKVIKFRHPITGDQMFGVRSTFDEAFAQPTGKFTDDEFYRQSVASILRRDKDLQAENLYGNIVADQGQAFVASKASQPRTVGGLRLPVGDQVRANFLMEKAGARTWFAETTAEIAKRASKSEYSAGFQKAIDDALANFDSAMANLGKLSPEEKAMYTSLKDDLFQLSKTDWAEVQAHHAQIVPKVAKPKTDAAIKKAAEAKAARKLEAQKSIDSGMPEWLLPMRDTLSARKNAMNSRFGNESGAASIDMLTGGFGKLISSIGKRIPRPGIENALDRGVMGTEFLDELSRTIQADEFAPNLINGRWQRPVLSDIESQVGSSSLSKLKTLRKRSSLGDKISSIFDSNGSTDMIRIISGSDEGQLMSISDWEKLSDSLPEEARRYLPEVATVKADTATRTKGVTVGGMDPADRNVNATGEFLIRPVDVQAWMYAGHFDRSIKPVRAVGTGRTKNSVSNNVMSIEQDFQRLGLATRLIERQDSVFPRLGVDRNTVETAEAGTSVWGKRGFDLDRYDNTAGQMNRGNSSSSPQWLDNMETYGLDAEYPDLYASIQAFKDGRNPGFSIKDIMSNPESSKIFRGSGWYGEKVYPKVEPKKGPVEKVFQQIVERQKAKARASTNFNDLYDQMARIARGEEKLPKPTLAARMLNRLTAPKAERSSVMDRLKARMPVRDKRSVLDQYFDEKNAPFNMRATLIPGPDDLRMAYDLGSAAMAAWRARNLVGASREELMFAKRGQKVGYAKKVSDLMEKLKARMPSRDKRSAIEQALDSTNTPFNMRAQLIPGPDDLRMAIDMLTGGLGRFLPKSRSRVEAQVRAGQNKKYQEDLDAWNAEFGDQTFDFSFRGEVTPPPEITTYLDENIIQSQVEASMAQRGGLKLPSLSRTKTEPSTRGEGLLANAIKKIKSNTPSAKKNAEEAARIKKLDEEFAIKQEREQQSAMRSRLNSKIRDTIDRLSRGNVELNRSSIEDLMGKISSAKKETEPLRWDDYGDSNKLDEYTVKANEFLQGHINKSMDDAIEDNRLLDANKQIASNAEELQTAQLQVRERASNRRLPADEIPLDELYKATNYTPGTNLITNPEEVAQWINFINLAQNQIPGGRRITTNGMDSQRISDPIANMIMNIQGYKPPLVISASRAAQIRNRRLIGTVAQEDSLFAARDAGPLPSDLTLPGDPLFRGYGIPSNPQYSTYDALNSFMYGENIIGGGYRVGGQRVGNSFSTARLIRQREGADLYSNPVQSAGDAPPATTRRLSPITHLRGEASMVRRGEGYNPREKFMGFEDTVPPRPIDIDITEEPVGAIIMGWLSRGATKETSFQDEIRPLLTEAQDKATHAGGTMDSTYYHLLSGDDVNGLRGNSRDMLGQPGGEVAIFNRSGMIMVEPDELLYPELSNMGEKIRTSYGVFDPNLPKSIRNIPPGTSLTDLISKGWLKLDKNLNLPQLRSGGTINNDNTLANLHQGEMVLTQPLTQKLNDGINALSYMLARPNNSMSSVSSGQPAQQVASAPVSYYNLTVQPSPGMDEDALANRVVRKLKDHERRVGMARR